MTKARGFDWATSALTLVMAAAAAFLIWSLAAENRELNAEITNLYARLDSLQETTALQISYAEGDLIPDTPVVGPTGEAAALSALVSRGGVIAFLTTTCPYCKEMLPVWAALHDEYALRGVPFVGVMLEDAAATSQYVADQSVQFPMWALADPASADVRVAIVPYTMLVEAGGVVQGVWSGVLEESETALLAAALEGELFAADQTLSGSSGRDPGCCETTALGTDAAGGQ